MQGPQQVLGRSPCGGTCPWSWAEPPPLQGSLHPCFPRTMVAPGLPSYLELSLGAVPGARPLRGPGGAKVWGVARQVVPVPGEMAGGSGVYRGPGTQKL